MMRIELTPSAWKAEVLPLNYIRTIKNWSGRRDSNSRPSPWQGDALPLSHFRMLMIIELNGRGRWIRTIESSANGFTVRPLWPLGNPSIKSALLLYHISGKCPVFFTALFCLKVGAGGGNRTPNLLITNQLLYR